MLPGLIPQLRSTEPLVTSFVTVATAFSTASTVYTFADVALGEPAVNRYIHVGMISETQGVADTVTINGVSATLLARVTETGPAPDLRCDVWYAIVPSGVTGDIVFDMDTASGFEDLAIVVYRSVNVLEPEHDSASGAGNTSTGFSFNVDAPARSYVVGVKGSTNAGITTTWTAGATEDTDTNAGNLSISSASGLVAIADATHTVSATYSNSTAVAIVFTISPES